MRLDTARIIINLFNAASKDETRLYLNGVNVESQGDGKFKLTATSGHILSSATVLDDSMQLAEGETRILATSNLAVLKLYVKGKINLLSRWDESKVFLGESFLLSLIEREFPKYQAVIPTKKGASQISFNVDLLAKLAKTMGKRKTNTITLNFNLEKDGTASLSPIVVTTSALGHIEAESVETMIIMPCKA